MLEARNLARLVRNLGIIKHNLMRNFKLITASILAIFVAILVVQNREPVEAYFLFATVVMPHAILLFIGFATGFALWGPHYAAGDKA